MTTRFSVLTKEATDRFAVVEGVRLHYNEAGGTHPIGLMSFHGGGPGATGWDNTRYNIDELSKHFRTLLIDLPGYGESDKSATLPPNTTTDDFFARLLKGLLDQLGIQRTHLYASSFSGPIGLRFALNYPERTGKVVLQASSASAGESLMFQPTPAEGIRALNEFRKNPVHASMERMMELFIPDENLRDPDIVERRWRSAMSPGHLEASLRWSRGPRSDVAADMRRLQAPVLCVWGQNDWMVPVEGAMRALAQIPGVRIHIWAGAGHFVQYERRDEFNRLVLDFLAH